MLNAVVPRDVSRLATDSDPALAKNPSPERSWKLFVTW
jgi:hypothetical protein